MKHRIRPSRSMSKISFFIGIFFCLFGLGFIIATLFVLDSPRLIATPFAVLWTAIAVYNTYRNYKNGFTDDGYSLYEIDSMEDSREQNFEEKLRQLERLREEQLISESEYREKRRKIMDKEW